MLPALILFAATYVLMLVFSKYRPYIALGSAAIFIVTGMLPLNEIIPNIDLNVLRLTYWRSWAATACSREMTDLPPLTAAGQIVIISPYS